MARGVPVRRDVPAVDTVQAAQPRDLLHIPDEVVDYFSGKGKRICLASNNDRSIDSRAIINSYPLHVDEFDDNDAEAQAMKKALIRANFRPTPEGYFRRSDNFLYTQTHAAYEYFVAEGQRMFAQQISPDSVHGKMAELTDELTALGLTESSVKAKYGEFPVG